MKHKEPLSAFIVPLIFGLTMVTAVMLYIIRPTEARKTVVIATEATTVEETLTEEEIEPETSEIESEAWDEQATSEKEIQADIQDEPGRNGDGNDEIVKTDDNGSACRCDVESNQISDGCDSDSYGSGIGKDSGMFIAYGIWSGAYWHFTPEQIDAQWSGLKPSKPALPTGTTRAWQRYLYERLSSIGAEWFYKYAVAQAMQESGFNPWNQKGNDAVPDKGLYSFRVYYWNPAYGDIYDYKANIDAYVSRIAPYLNDRSEQGIYLALSQHYNPNGQIHMEYVNHVLGRLNELWEVE